MQNQAPQFGNGGGMSLLDQMSVPVKPSGFQKAVSFENPLQVIEIAPALLGGGAEPMQLGFMQPQIGNGKALSPRTGIENPNHYSAKLAPSDFGLPPPI